MASAEEAVALEQFVVFDLGGERYGLPVAAVDEIVRRPDQLTRVPLAPPFVDGIMSLRGKMIPVIDQRQRFAVDGQTDGRARRVIILTIDGLQTGITVDKVTEILSVRQSELRAVPEMDEAGAAVVDRVAIGQRHGDMILLIDPRALLDRAERDMLASMRSGQ
jgi:purine-binding chemotaxis protein CheW